MLMAWAERWPTSYTDAATHRILSLPAQAIVNVASNSGRLIRIMPPIINNIKLTKIFRRF